MCEGYIPGWQELHPDAPPRPNWTFAGKYPLEMPVEQVLDRSQEVLEAGYFLGDSFPKFYVNIGPGVLAAFLGGQYQLLPDTTWFSPPVTPQGVSWENIPLDQLSVTFDEQNHLWQRVRDLTRAAVDRWEGQLVIGMTDLGGNLDVLASLIGAQRLAMELLDHPDEIERLCSEIRQAWLSCYEILHAVVEPGGMGSACWASIWAPERYYMFQSDFAYMISPSMFRRFVIPDLQACCQSIPYSFYHLDGKGQIRHLDLLLSLEQLRGIQWIPGDGTPPPEGWLPLLKRIRDGGKLCQVYVSANGARKILDELGGKGFALEIVDDLTRDQAERLVEELAYG
jgi:5-methyltetrahydrofolate--homocysteine methyltransferase